MSPPTMVVGFTRYSRDSRFSVLGGNHTFLIVMAVWSVIGTFIGGRRLGMVPETLLLPFLAVILVFSDVKVWRYK